MAIKPTIFKAELEISDVTRNYYATHAVTLARHSSETDERMMVRLLAFACHAHEFLTFTEGLANGDEPALWQKDLSGSLELWIDLGQPDERRLQKACGRADQVVVYTYANSTQIWWNGMSDRLKRTPNLTVYQIPTAGLAALAERTMKLECMIQDGQIWLTAGDETLQLELTRLEKA